MSPTEVKHNYNIDVVDIVRTLANSSESKKYWNKIKQEENETSEKIGQLKLRIKDGRKC